MDKQKKQEGENEAEKERLTAMIEQVEKENKDLIEENEWLREMVNDNGTIYTQDDKGHYTSDIQQCVCELLNYNVSYGQVGPVIQTVLKLASLKASDIPSRSTINNWNIMRLILSQKQLAEELPDQSTLGLLSDETSKFGRKFEGFHASDSEGRMRVLGLRDITSKAGHDVLETFRNILQDIEDVATNAGEVSKKILLNIKCTMSDRASTQIKFNESLEDYRKTVLPDICENYESLSEVERESLGKLCNFFCGLHALVHMATMASTSLLETQSGLVEGDSLPIFDKSFMSGSEPGAIRLVRTASKAAAYGGDEKSGCHGRFAEFMSPTLKSQGYSRLPLEPFRGNRFNVVFKNAACVFFLAENLNTFLESNATNKLLKSVKYDLNIPQYLAGCKALGLVSYLVTMPLWTTIEDGHIHILYISSRYQEIIDFLITASTNVSDL